ncbi:hypothetical protein M758_8G091500 [Ceratodon purpureus]|uniref:Uncharacterized protein n=1 Tax=Ceratodon purpureus TaxID=3225 RepID=A0A8T0GX34_CERPU|nr:hypothetical protein KC19_8G095500 [Ceratodon purpureus]KAG0608255.1 hypothetical protein M758_8G091500 [Ceratodon purpureus]
MKVMKREGYYQASQALFFSKSIAAVVCITISFVIFAYQAHSVCWTAGASSTPLRFAFPPWRRGDLFQGALPLLGLRPSSLFVVETLEWRQPILSWAYIQLVINEGGVRTTA